MCQVKLIVSNWKMNLNINQARTLTNKLKKIQIKNNLIKNIICPQFILLPIISNIIKESDILLGAQDCHYKKFGAYTGDTSIELLKEVGCKYVIIGHSERRKEHHETNNIIRQKAQLVISEKLKPIICIGESLKERKNNKYLNILEEQLKVSIPHNLDEIIIAYEPIWSIGTGLVPTEEEIKEIKNFTYDFVFKSKNISKIFFLYGGSVNSENINEIFKLSDVNGALIGGSSLKFEEINKILTFG